MPHDRVLSVRDFRVGAHRGARPPLPDDVVYVGRPSRWGNPWRHGQACSSRHQLPSIAHEPGVVLDRQAAVDHFAAFFGLYAGRHPEYYLAPLRGKRLACWCAPLACHADVIAQVLERWEGQQHGEG